MSHERWKQRLAKYLLDGLGADDIQTSFADVTLVVEGYKFPCNRIMLSALSPFFQKMFTDDFLERTQKEVSLGVVSSDVMTDILAFIQGRQDIPKETADRLFDAGCCLQMECLRDRSEEVLISNLDSSNAILIWRLGKTHNVESVLKVAKAYILQHFDKVKNETDFTSLDVNEMIELVCDDLLQTSNEQNVIEAVMSWIKHDAKNREDLAGTVFQFLKLPLVSLSYLFRLTSENPFLYKSEVCQTMLEEAKKIHTSPEERYNYVPTRMTNRTTSSKIDVVVFLTANSDGKTMAAFCPKTKAWKTLARNPKDHGQFFASCTYLDNIYISGGTDQNHTIMHYTSCTNKWTELISIKCTQRYNHSMVRYKDRLFLFGGRNYKTVITAFDVVTREMTDVGHLHVGVEDMATIILDQKAIIVGGRCSENDEKGIDTVQSFDFVTNQCTIVGKIPIPVISPALIPVGGKIYLLHDQVAFEIEIDEEVHSKEVGSFKNWHIKGKNVCCFEDVLYVAEESAKRVEKKSGKEAITEGETVNNEEEVNEEENDEEPVDTDEFTEMKIFKDIKSLEHSLSGLSAVETITIPNPKEEK